MKAVQSWAPLKYPPLVIGDLVLADNAYWIFRCICHSRLDLIFACRFTLGMISYKRFDAEHRRVRAVNSRVDSEDGERDSQRRRETAGQFRVTYAKCMQAALFPLMLVGCDAYWNPAHPCGRSSYNQYSQRRHHNFHQQATIAMH